MVFQKYIFYLTFIVFPLFIGAQTLGFNKLLQESPLLQMPFSVENNRQNYDFLVKEGIQIKNETKDYLFFTQSAQWISEKYQKGELTNFHFEYSLPTLLGDSARAHHFVDSVYFGVPPLLQGYTGNGVILGIVDSGLDFDHPDFIDELGRKRVIRYWNHNVENATNSPQPYGYGQVWSESYIQNNSNTVTSLGSLNHGTTVTGVSGGNGLANGRNRGMAPEVDIIFVESNFNIGNWTLSIADACDYIFKVADSLNKPAVINLSLGSLLGSRDGKDPAAQLMEQLVNAHPGRIIIGSAGNSGNNHPFHAHGEMSISDTSFIWMENQPDGALGQNFALFDLWSDINDAQWWYSLGVVNPTTYELVASSDYRFSQLNVGTPIFDTIYNSNGDRIANLEIYSEYQGDNFHLQGFFSDIDSTDYLLQFSTTGIGAYDLWSGEELGLNKLVTEIPSSLIFPPIVNYVMPDSAQSVVSSWNCSPQIISVANIRNRAEYLTYSGDYYSPNNTTVPGDIALTSSRGPNRLGHTKPDISAVGEMSLASAPMYMVNNPEAYGTTLDDGGYHQRNGGTSMASPVVAGIAALYLERCPKSTQAEFMADLFGTAYQDEFTGNLPNNRFGYGKVNAFDLIKEKNGNLTILGDTAICQMPIALVANTNLQNYTWSTGAHDSQIIVSSPSSVHLHGNDMQGCLIYSDTIQIVQGSPLANPTISLIGDTLFSSEAPNYQWYFNDHPISGATQSYYIPGTQGYYSVAIQGEDNCKSFSHAFSWLLSLAESSMDPIILYPNPTSEVLTIKAKNQEIQRLEITSITGQLVFKAVGNQSDLYKLDVHSFASGSYLVRLQTNQGLVILPFFKQ